MEIKKICVVGPGAMGHGIAQVCAQGGYEVNLRGSTDKSVQAGVNSIRKFLDGGVQRKRMTQEQADSVLSRIKPLTDLNEAAKDVDLVIEARTEDMNLKKETFTELDQICPEHTIFATNTSYMSVTEIAMVTKRADKFLGTHWFNPPQLMRGVEVVRTEKTSQEVVDTVVDLLKKLGKEPAVCKDTSGFVVNRVLQVWYNEGLKLLDEGVATPQDVDKAIKTAYNFRMGPFELRDMVGMDTALLGTEIIHRELGKELFRPARCMVAKVRGGDFGRKTGRGFYEYK